MAFEKLKDQLRENWADLSSKINENSAFNNLRERFEGQSPTVQKAIVGGLCGLLALFLLSFPWSYLSDAQDHLAQFEENRGLIQGLLRATRSVKEPSPLPPPVGVDMIRGRVDQILKEARLIPEQVGSIQPLPDRPAKDLAPAVVIQTGLVVQLKKLNLDQIMNLSVQFQNLGPGTKLMGIDLVQSPGQDHYYEMNARLVNFALPSLTLESAEPPEKGPKGRGSKRPARKTEEEQPE